MIRFFTNRRLAKLKVAWIEAKAAYEDAVRRNDTRAQHDRWPALRDATTRYLRAEVANK